MTTAATLKKILLADEALLAQVHRLRAPRLTKIMRAFTRLGDTESWIAIGLVLLAAGGPGPALAWKLWLGAALGALSAQPLKRILKRARPHHAGFIALAEIPDAFSFPSGHTATAVAVAIVFAGRGDFLGSLTAMLALGIGSSRVYLGAHYPLDVAAGAGLGAAAGLLARLIV